MKTWPLVIIERYPLEAERVGTRPWWRAGHGTLLPYLRSDGRIANSLQNAAAIDTAHPLVFPGLRVGQVWASVRPDGVLEVEQVLHAVEGGSHPGKPCSSVHTTIDVRTWQTAVCFDYARLARTMFLLADPCCPWLAPWAPAEAP